MNIKKSLKCWLIKLLKNDAEVQELVRDIAKSKALPKIEVVVSESIVTNEPAAPEPITDTLRQQLADDLTLLNLLANDEILRNDWLGIKPASEGEQLRQLLAVAAQWERILDLWGFIANRCKQEQRPASSAEQHLVSASVAIHNLIWRNKAASVCNAEINSMYDYEQHERGNIKGDKVCEQWLLGLKNSAGQLQKKPLVKTQ